MLSSCGAVGLPTAFPCGHRRTVGIDWDPPMCLDAQGGIKAKRQPCCGWCCLEVMCPGRGRRDVLSCTFCQMLELRKLAPPARLEALFTSSQWSPFVPSRIRGSRFLASDCVLNPSQHFRVQICSVLLLEVRVVPLLKTLQPDRCSSGASSSR